MENKDVLDLAEKNVVRIECENVIQNILIPYQKKTLGNSFGSGFFISNKHILTNHHVIETSTKIFINIPFVGKQTYLATLACYNIDNDYAILEIQGYEHKGKLFKIGDSHKLNQGEKLSVCGFPLGNINPNLKIVNGMVTGWERNKIQHDTNTNPGMSGGMILNSKNEVVGIHIGVITGKGWTNTAYAIPIKIINIPKRLNMLKSNKKYPINIKTPVFGFTTQTAHIGLLKAIIKNNKYLKPGYGVVVNKIYSNYKTLMQSGDILLKAQNHTIDNFKDINYKCNLKNKITYEYLSDYSDVGDKYEIIFYSKNKNKLIKESHEFKEYEDYETTSLKDIDYLKDTIPYVNIGGIIVSELTSTHLQLFANNKQADLVYKFMKYKNKNKNGKTIIVTHLYPTTPIYKNKIIKMGSIVKQINGVDINSIEDYITQLKKSKKYATFILENNKIEILDMEQTKKIEPIISKQFNYPMMTI